MPKRRAIRISLPLLLLAALLWCGFARAPQRHVPQHHAPQRRTTADVREMKRVPFCAAVPDDSLRTLYDYTDAVMRLHIDGDSAAAEAVLSALLLRDSTYAPAWYELAGVLMDAHPEAAAEAARRAVMRDSTDKWYLQRFARALVLSGRYGEALHAYERLAAVNRDPDDYRILAILYEHHERPFSAIAILDSAATQFGENPLLTGMKRRLLLSTRQYDRALEEGLRLVETRPYENENYVALGEIYEARGEDSLARAAFERAVAIDSADMWALVSLGDYYARHNASDEHLGVAQRLFESEELSAAEKISVFERLTSDMRFYRDHYMQLHRLAATLYMLYPDDGDVADLYAVHQLRSGNAAAASEVYKNRLRHADSVQLQDYLNVAAVESILGQTDSVEYYLREAVERFPHSTEALVHYAGVWYESDPGRAEALFRRGLKYASDDRERSRLWGYTGDLYHSEAERRGGSRSLMKRCYAAYDKALKYDADNVSVLNNYAYFLALEGRDRARALRMSSRAVELEPDNATYLDTHAWVLYGLGRLDEAKRYLRTALSLDRTGNPELRLHYGDILAALGENYMAEVYWRRALEGGYDDPQAVERRIASLRDKKEGKTE